MCLKRIFLAFLTVFLLLVYLNGLYQLFVTPHRTFLRAYGIDSSRIGEHLQVSNPAGKGLGDDPLPLGLVSPGERVGIRKGDVVEAIGRDPGRMHRADSFRSVVAGLASAGPIETLYLQLKSDDKASRLVKVTLTAEEVRLYSSKWSPTSLVAILFSLIALLTGAFIGFQKTGDANAFMAALMFLGFSYISMGTSGLSSLPAVLIYASIFASVASNGLLPYYFFRFFLLFPSPCWLDRKLPWLKTALLWICIPVACLGFLQTALHLESFRAAAVVEKFETGTDVFFNYLYLALFLVGLVSLALNTFGAKSPDEKRRMRILLAGTLASMLPLIVLIVLQELGLRAIPTWAVLIVLALLTLFPLTFFYVILKHRVMGLRLIIRRGIRYLLVSRGFLAFEGLFLFLFFFWLAESFCFSLIARAGQGVTAGTTAVVAIVAASGLRTVNRRVMPLIDRRFFREAYDARRILSDLSRAIHKVGCQTEKMLQTVVDRISDSLHPDHIAIFLRPTGQLALPAAANGNGQNGAAGIGAGGGTLSGCFQCVKHRMRSGHAGHDAVYSHVFYESLSLPADARVLGPLWDGRNEDPVAVEVDLEDPSSWVSELQARSSLDDGLAAELSVLKALDARLLVPIFSGGQPWGVIVLGGRLSEEPYGEEDKALLLSVSQQTSLALDYGRLMRQEAEQIKFQNEIEIAKDVQSCLFPQRMPAMESLDYVGICRAARGVGGDYYDFVSLGDGLLGIALGDVSGKGISAALLMANLQATLRSHASLHRDKTDRVVADVNRLLTQATGCGKYATFFYAVFEESTGKLTYTNAGHNAPLLVRRTSGEAGSGRPPAIGVERLEVGGVPVGLFEDAGYDCQTVDFRPGDALVVFTDGVTEAENKASEEFGEERLTAFVRDLEDLPAGEVAERLMDRLNSFVEDAEQHDDITLVVLRRIGSLGAGRTPAALEARA